MHQPIWNMVGLCPVQKPLDIGIIEPGIEGTMLETFDQGIELRRHCTEDDCVFYRVFRRYVPQHSKKSLPHTTLEVQIDGADGTL
jgi:hypothetical protein